MIIPSLRIDDPCSQQCRFEEMQRNIEGKGKVFLCTHSTVVESFNIHQLQSQCNAKENHILVIFRTKMRLK